MTVGALLAILPLMDILVTVKASILIEQVGAFCMAGFALQ
jgi:hypothetical protein